MPEQFEDAVELMRALGSGPRLEIMCCLLDGETNVTDICDRLGMAQSGVSQHLARLRTQGLVVATRRGQYVNYALPANVVRDVVAFIDHKYGIRANSAHGAVLGNGSNGARNGVVHTLRLSA
jgi:ArsR family transcriptional regulator